MGQTREASGFATAEALPGLFTRVVNITPASIVSGSGAEQVFAVVNMLAGDVLVAASNSSAGQTAGVVAVPGRISSAGGVGIDFIFGGGTVTATAVAVIAGFYNLTIFRRG